MDSGKDVLDLSRISSSGIDPLATKDSLLGITKLTTDAPDHLGTTQISARDRNVNSLTASGVADDLDLALKVFRKQ